MRLSGATLLQHAVERGQACGAEDLIVVTNQDYLFLTRDVLKELANAPRTRYLLEPKGRNTAPAIALAALACERRHGPEAVMLVLPADHLIPDTEAFVANALEATRHAMDGKLVVFGISPTSPETGFGYIEVEAPSHDTQQARCFVEKPDTATAIAYLASGRYYWNSGMFCFTSGAILEALRQHAPAILEAAQCVWETCKTLEDISRFDAQSFALQPDISIDYAVMERASNVMLVPAKFAWSDVGSWPAVAAAHTADDSGNTLLKNGETLFLSLDTSGTHIQVESHGPKVVATVGVHDFIIVDTPDALLIAHKSVAQKVKTIVDTLRERNHESTHLPSAVPRPWGTYSTLKEESGYKVKRITVNPGQSLSLQYHHQRAEHWIVVQGTALVQIGDEEFRTLPGEYRYIPLQEKHRLTNIGTDEMVLIEVQCGAYLGEDDIVRLADTYSRV